MKHIRSIFRDRDTSDILLTSALTLPHVGALLTLVVALGLIAEVVL